MVTKDQESRKALSRREAIPRGYKRTEVGVIPKDWTVVQLAQLSAFITKGATPTTYGFPWEDSGVLFLRSECVSAEGLDLTDSMYISQDAHAALHRSQVQDGDILITITGNVGRVAILAGVGSANINQHIARIRIVAPDVDSHYVLYYLSQDQVRQTFETITTGQAYPQISLVQVREAKIALPSLSEQRAIAEVLSEVDELIVSLGDLIAKKQAIKKATMQQLLTGRTRLPGFEKKWISVELKELVRDFIVPMRDKPKQFSGNIPWCRIEDFDGVYLEKSKSGRTVSEQTIENMNLKVYSEGTLLVSCSADLGRCAIVAKPLVSNQTFIGLEMKQGISSNLFFYYYMQFRSDDLNDLSSGTTISYLSREQFEEFNVKVPSLFAEQDAIGSILLDMDKEIEKIKTQKNKVQKIKKGMMQQLLTGRIRIVEPKKSEAAA